MRRIADISASIAPGRFARAIWDLGTTPHQQRTKTPIRPASAGENEVFVRYSYQLPEIRSSGSCPTSSEAPFDINAAPKGERKTNPGFRFSPARPGSPFGLARLTHSEYLKVLVLSTSIGIYN